MLVLAGATGRSLGRGRTGPAVARKRGRMRFVAAAAVGVLIPAALFLAWKADARAFDATFHAVQVLELAAGALNLALLGLDPRDGLRLTGRLVRPGSRVRDG